VPTFAMRWPFACVNMMLDDLISLELKHPSVLHSCSVRARSNIFYTWEMSLCSPVPYIVGMQELESMQQLPHDNTDLLCSHLSPAFIAFLRL
jgi:hypothetical protein